MATVPCLAVSTARWSTDFTSSKGPTLAKGQCSLALVRISFHPRRSAEPRPLSGVLIVRISLASSLIKSARVPTMAKGARSVHCPVIIAPKAAMAKTARPANAACRTAASPRSPAAETAMGSKAVMTVAGERSSWGTLHNTQANHAMAANESRTSTRRGLPVPRRMANNRAGTQPKAGTANKPIMAAGNTASSVKAAKVPSAATPAPRPTPEAFAASSEPKNHVARLRKRHATA